MPTWAGPVIQWAVEYLLKNLDQAWAKHILALGLRKVDAAVQSEDASLPSTNAFKGVADEVAAAFHSSVEGIASALGQ